MEERIILALFLSSFLGFNQGCQIGGSISLGPVPQQLFINDTFRGNIISEATTDVVGITGINYGGALVGGPYLDITHVDSQFVVRPSGAFDQYEENEVALFISVTVTFSCTGGSTSPLILVVNIRDTNNNDPQFRPSNDFEFVVAPPLPPGFLVTGCFNDITVRDVDLTTSRIIFEIEDNPYFEIDYDAAASAVAPSKEFKAVLKTSTFIRTLREPVTLRITATDVDATGDPSRTTSGTIRISGDTEFEFPEEPVFTQTFYIAHYTADHQLILSETISLQQGFDANVNFTLDGEYRSYFTLTPTGNQVYLAVSTHLPVEVLAENQIYLIVRADREYTSGASATIVIYLPEETPLLFANALYEGAIVDGDLQLSTLVLVQGYEGATVTAEIVGEHSTRFTANVQGNQVNLSMAPITDSFIDDNSFLTIQVFASTDRSEAMTIVSLEIIKDDNVTPAFDKSIYTGSYDPDNGLNIEPITFIQGFDETVSVELFGEYESLFQIIVPGPTVIVSSSTLPPEIFAEQRITLSIEATKQRTVRANAVIIIYLPAARQLEFGMDTYRGMILDNELSVQNISLSVGYDQNVQFNLSGDHSTYFDVTNVQNQVTITLPGSLPDSVITQNSAIMLTVTATGLNALATTTSILLDILKDDRTTPIFSQNIYHGVYKSLLDFEIDDIFLSQGFDDEVSFRLDDSAHAQYFAVSSVGSNVTIALRSAIPEDVIFEQKVLLFNILADKALTVGSNSAVLIRFPAELIEPTVMKFTKASYVGTFEQKNITVESIILETGYSPGTEFLLLGEYAHHFQLSNTNNEVQISNNITNTLPSDIDLYFIILTVEAQSEGAVPAWASVVIEIVKEGRIYPVFNQAFYRGSYTEENKLQFVENVYLAAGYNENVTFHLQGDYATWFSVSQTGNSVTLVLVSDIPPGILQDNNQLLFSIIALNTNGASARAVISIDLPTDSPIQPDVYFEKTIFEGIIQNAVVSHEPIRLFGFTGGAIELVGEFSSLFEAGATNGLVTVTATEPFSLPQGNTHVVLELQAGTAKSVIIFNVIQNDGPATPPVVTFSATSYAVRVEVSDTGLVGHVQAEADNGEAVRYTLQLTSEHLQQRLSVNDLGELHLSAPANSGRYTFLVEATTIFTQASGTATVHLSVEAITVCGEDIVMPPLIVLDRDEEEPHFNLVNAYEGCHFSLSNRWPEDQAWLFVNETGLHTSSIDREHESIAFMALSQVQVEITLHCDTDTARIKRSLYSLNSQALALNDFGTSKWILTDTILYNSRRSLVNLIVNDINDNAPIFEGKDQEPIAVGYPVPELEEKVLPRSLAELQATDADIGENAELLYWSSESVLAVAPTTGFVHVRDTAILEHGSRLTVNATDRNGQGLTGSIDIVVRLLDQSNILVVTVRDTFLHDEKNVLSRLSESVGYQIKVLRSVVVSNEEIAGRTKREAGNPGASLQLYVYGLIEREPVTVEQLTVDINAAIAEVNIASAVSLEDHLAAQEICVIPGRDTGLLVATIILSVLLFIIIVLIAVWFFLRWRKGKNYNQFSDANSLASRNESIEEISKPAEVSTKPRLNIEALKKSEKRLREILEAPVEDVLVEPATSRSEAILDMPLPMDTNTPIVIQSIDKLKDAADDSSDDEFGERKRPKRKSVVTFNENVEKIIHVEETDPEDISTSPGYEIYKL